MTPTPSRRRFLTIAAGACAIAALPGQSRAAEANILRWKGSAMGAEAQVLLPAADAARLLPRIMAEVERLEGVFSLYRADSVLARLNRDGRIDNPPPEMIDLLGRAASMSARSGGAFDVTVQPLWQLYAAQAGAPSAADVQAALSVVGWRGVTVSDRSVRLARPGMALTLNGIAQGYVTDRVARMLRADGVDRVLIDLGETRALGSHPGGRPWQIGFDGGGPIALSDGAVATSAGAGTSFDAAGRNTHILDPRSGAAHGQWASVTVEAPTATEADALSTALILLQPAQVRALMADSTARRAWLTDAAGQTTVVAGSAA